jgi:hypothetical protein
MKYNEIDNIFIGSKWKSNLYDGWIFSVKSVNIDANTISFDCKLNVGCALGEKDGVVNTINYYDFINFYHFVPLNKKLFELEIRINRIKNQLV